MAKKEAFGGKQAQPFGSKKAEKKAEPKKTTKAKK